MTTLYTEEDRAYALATFLPLIGTDVEINASTRGNDIIVRVNKTGILVCRIMLEDAAREMTSQALVAFSPVAPDFAFRVGDTQAGIERVRRALGLA